MISLNLRFSLVILHLLTDFHHAELSLMFSLLDRIPNGVVPMLQDIETYVVQSGVDDMKSNAETIVTVSKIAPTLAHSSA